MHLLLHNDHFALIKDVKKVANFFRCHFCNAIYNKYKILNLHLKTCNGGKKKIRYPGGGYGLSKSIFDKLNDEGIHIPRPDQFYPYRITFDFECTLPPIENVGTGKLRYTNECIPASVSVCSNITSTPDTEEPGEDGTSADDRAFTPAECIIHEDPSELVRLFFDLLNRHWRMAYDRMCEKFQHVIHELAEKTAQLRVLEQDIKKLEEEEELKTKGDEIARMRHWALLHEDFVEWIMQVPVLGFNSSNFDLNLIRIWFVPFLFKEGAKLNKPITRGNAYLTLSTDRFLFLDVMNYVAGGISYANLLKMFNVEEQKGHFPYEWFTSVEKLSEGLPPQKDFYAEKLYH
jgi:hypothetical protein